MTRMRGVALLTAIVILAIATTLAVAVGFRSALAARRATGNFAIEQALQAGAAAEALAAYALSEDARRNQIDSLDEPWHQPVGPVEIADDILVEGRLEDLDGRFNVNSLVDDTGAKDPVAFDIFTRLLQALD
ncbi:MAG: type II secretion system protein GspK, partial [Steroidobacteraceae bacterium]|nr:type II secretion system protein GspK [Steroidobacteraceae bacterium]